MVAFIIIGCQAIFLLYFLSGLFYIIKKPQIIISRKLLKTQQLYNIISIEDYLNNLGKKNICISIIYIVGFIISFYRDIHKYPTTYLIVIVYLILNGILNYMFDRRINKYLVKKNTNIIDN